MAVVVGVGAWLAAAVGVAVTVAVGVGVSVGVSVAVGVSVLDCAEQLEDPALAILAYTARGQELAARDEREAALDAFPDRR